jgi:thiol-disulfide isomerase/thioredoxin
MDRNNTSPDVSPTVNPDVSPTVNNDRWVNDRWANDRWANDRLRHVGPENDWQPDRLRAFAKLQQRNVRRHSISHRWSWGVVGAVLLAIPLMALPPTRVIAQRCVSACVRESSRLRELLLGAPIQSSQSTYVKWQDRKIAPDFTMTDTSGRQVRLSDFHGKAVLLNFWATWCGPCRKEIPLLNQFQQTYEQDRLTVLGVSLEESGWEVVKPYMAAVQFHYPVMIGPQSVAPLYGGLDVIPTTLLIDKFGRIAAVHVGICNRSEYEADINAVLKEH